jgi:hypothetical protein
VPQGCHAEAKRRALLPATGSEADSFQARVDAVAVMTNISGDRPLLSHVATATVLQRNRLVFRSQVLATEAVQERPLLDPVHTYNYGVTPDARSMLR